MHLLKRIVIVLVLLIALLLVIAFFLPSKVHVERSIAVNAPAGNVYANINDLKNWSKWSPWEKLDLNMEKTYEGSATGSGAKMKWKSALKEVGSGSITISDSKTDEHVKYDITIIDRGKANAMIALAPETEGTRVNWSMEMDVGMNPVGRWMGLFMDQMMGGMFEKGLEDLKNASEAIQIPAQPAIEPMQEDSTTMDSTAVAAA